MDGLSAASSGMLADERMQQVIMNNIANLSTPGYKQSTGVLSAFPAQLAQKYMAGSNGANAKTLGVVNNGTLFQESVSNFTQGQLATTNQPLDLAITDPMTSGTSVYAATANGTKTVSTLSFVVGKGGVIETANGDPILAVDATGKPVAGARVVVNKAFTGLDLFGETGSPVIDAKGHPSYTIVDSKGNAVSGLHLSMTSSSTGGMHAFFAVENVDAQGKSRVALTRDGHFQAGSNHLLYNAAGQRVLAIGANGQPILNSAIYLNKAYTGTAIFGKNGAPLKDAQGNLSYEVVGLNGKPLANATFTTTEANVNTLQPLGTTDFLMTPSTQLAASQATITPGALELSNANDTQNMVDMLTVYRSYEANSKVILTISTQQQSTDQLGAVANL